MAIKIYISAWFWYSFWPKRAVCRRGRFWDQETLNNLLNKPERKNVPKRPPGFKMAQDRPRTVQDSPRQAQDSPKTAQDRPKTAPRQPKTTPRQPMWSQDRPQNDPKLGPRKWLKTSVKFDPRNKKKNNVWADGLEYRKISLSWAKKSPARTILEAFGPKMPPKIAQDGRSSWPGEPQDRSKLAQQQSCRSYPGSFWFKILNWYCRLQFDQDKVCSYNGHQETYWLIVLIEWHWVRE